MEVAVAVQSGWRAPPCSESAAQKKSFCPQRRGLLRSLSGDPEEELPIPEQLRDPISFKSLSEQVFGTRKVNVVQLCIQLLAGWLSAVS